MQRLQVYNIRVNNSTRSVSKMLHLLHICIKSNGLISIIFHIVLHVVRGFCRNRAIILHKTINMCKSGAMHIVDPALLSMHFCNLCSKQRGDRSKSSSAFVHPKSSVSTQACNLGISTFSLSISSHTCNSLKCLIAISQWVELVHSLARISCRECFRRLKLPSDVYNVTLLYCKVGRGGHCLMPSLLYFSSADHIAAEHLTIAFEICLWSLYPKNC